MRQLDLTSFKNLIPRFRLVKNNAKVGMEGSTTRIFRASTSLRFQLTVFTLIITLVINSVNCMDWPYGSRQPSPQTGGQGQGQYRQPQQQPYRPGTRQYGSQQSHYGSAPAPAPAPAPASPSSQQQTQTRWGNTYQQQQGSPPGQQPQQYPPGQQSPPQGQYQAPQQQQWPQQQPAYGQGQPQPPPPQPPVFNQLNPHDQQIAQAVRAEVVEEIKEELEENNEKIAELVVEQVENDAEQAEENGGSGAMPTSSFRARGSSWLHLPWTLIILQSLINHVLKNQLFG